MRNSRPPKQIKTTPQVCQALTVKLDNKFSWQLLLWPSYTERAVPPTCTALASCQKVAKASRLVIAAAAARVGKGRSYGHRWAMMNHTRALATSSTSRVSMRSGPLMAATRRRRRHDHCPGGMDHLGRH